MKAEDKLREMAEALAEEGCDPIEVGELEAKLIEEIHRMRKEWGVA